MKTDEMIDKILKRYNEIEENKAQLPLGEYNFTGAFMNGETSSIYWVLINIFGFKVDDKRF